MDGGTEGGRVVSGREREEIFEHTVGVYLSPRMETSVGARERPFWPELTSLRERGSSQWRDSLEAKESLPTLHPLRALYTSSLR